ncbi:MAG: VIT domain-containing protein, partial [Planctomycetota bacterium]
MKKELLPVWTALLTAAAVYAVAAGQELPPAMMVKVEEKSEPLGISKVETDVRIFGLLAETKMTMVFSNPHDRALEGELYFPLPDGATVSGYALDVNGVMVDGVAVEKHRARQIFEAEVRKGVDPGLVEYVKGNNFRTRVFPIPARGSRTVMVSYVSDIIEGKDGAAYQLPLNFKDKVGEFSLRVEVVKAAAEPKIEQGELANFTFKKWRDSYVAETKLADAALTKPLVIAVPDVEKQNVLVEKAPDGQYYFVIHDRPASDPLRGVFLDDIQVDFLIKATAATTQPLTAPKLVRFNSSRAYLTDTRVEGFVPDTVLVLWDASGSRGVDHGREFELISEYIASLGKRRVEIDLVVFRNTTERPRRIVSDGLAGSELIAELKKVQYDGGSRAPQLDWGKRQAKDNRTPADVTLLFTDGLFNFGSRVPSGLEGPVYVFSSGAAVNTRALRLLAANAGGQYFNLARMDVKEVAASIGRQAFSFISARDMAGGTHAAIDLYPRLAQPVTGRFTLVGRLVADRAMVMVDYGFGGKATTSSQYEIFRKDAVEGDLLRRFWAQKKLDHLMIDQEANREPIIALGKAHGLVTPFTSLLVLERLEQYVEHRVRPPKSLPKMREQYEKAFDTIEMQKKKDEQKQIERIVALWQQRVEWWNKEFKYPKDFTYKAKAPPAAPASGRAERPTASADRPAPGHEAPNLVEGRFLDDLQDGWPADAFVGAERLPAQPAAKAASRGGQPAIAMKPWDPDTPYLEELKAPKPEARFDVYMKQREKYGNSPSFFLDCADFFYESKQPALGLQVLSNIAEMELENPQLLRVLGHRLAQLGELDLAIQVFEEVLELRPEEPQSCRDLALVLAGRAVKGAPRRKPDIVTGDNSNNCYGVLGLWAWADSAKRNYTRSLKLLNDVVMRKWDRFDEIELVALMEANAILPLAKAAGLADNDIPLDKRLIKLLACDVRIVLTWDADATDMDLHVIEPSGERVMYNHNRSTIGGL